MGQCLKRTQLSFSSQAGYSSSVTSNQAGVHPDLTKVVQRHLQFAYQKPIAAYTCAVLESMEQHWRKTGGQLILDSGCGTGVGTNNLADQFPEDCVIGIDQSMHRLSRQKPTLNSNMLLIRANLIDVWLLMYQQGWKIDRHLLLYPNPWPKKKHLQRRWHGHPVFPTLISLSRSLEVRSNWKTYLEEFLIAVNMISKLSGNVELYNPVKTITPFEQKYFCHGQCLYRTRLTFAKS